MECRGTQTPGFCSEVLLYPSDNFTRSTTGKGQDLNLVSGYTLINQVSSPGYNCFGFATPSTRQDQTILGSGGGRLFLFQI